MFYSGLLWWLSGKEAACQCRRHGFDPWVRKIPWRRKWKPISVFLPEKSHGQRSLVGYGPQGQSMGSLRVRHNLATTQQHHVLLWCFAKVFLEKCFIFREIHGNDPAKYTLEWRFLITLDHNTELGKIFKTLMKNSLIPKVVNPRSRLTRIISPSNYKRLRMIIIFLTSYSDFLLLYFSRFKKLFLLRICDLQQFNKMCFVNKDETFICLFSLTDPSKNWKLSLNILIFITIYAFA